MEVRRYYVDLRVGCIAVRDRTLDGDDHGLLPETPGVIKFWCGSLVSKECPTCHCRSSEYIVSEEIVAKAEKLCEELNQS